MPGRSVRAVEWIERGADQATGGGAVNAAVSSWLDDNSGHFGWLAFRLQHTHGPGSWGLLRRRSRASTFRPTAGGFSWIPKRGGASGPSVRVAIGSAAGCGVGMGPRGLERSRGRWVVGAERIIGGGEDVAGGIVPYLASSWLVS